MAEGKFQGFDNSQPKGLLVLFWVVVIFGVVLTLERLLFPFPRWSVGTMVARALDYGSWNVEL